MYTHTRTIYMTNFNKSHTRVQCGEERERERERAGRQENGGEMPCRDNRQGKRRGVDLGNREGNSRERTS